MHIVWFLSSLISLLLAAILAWAGYDLATVNEKSMSRPLWLFFALLFALAACAFFFLSMAALHNVIVGPE